LGLNPRQKCSNDHTNINLIYESALMHCTSLGPICQWICTLNFQAFYNDAGNKIMYV